MNARATRLTILAEPARLRARSLSPQSQYSGYTRHSQFDIFRDEEYKQRKSLAHYVDDDMKRLGQTLFHQRVFILAKNKTPDNVQLPSPMTSISSQDQVPSVTLQTELERIANECSENAVVAEKLTGLHLYMDDYTFLVLEGNEDMIGDCLGGLAKIINDYWSANRVVQTEDKIQQTYFDQLLFRNSSSMNINEKFPPATPNDPALMGRQHLIITEKLHSLCETLSLELRFEVEETSVDELDVLTLSPVKYNRLLVEVQRIELVLSCKRFYQTVEKSAKLYGAIPLQMDDDAFAWPTPYNYMPTGCFQRSQYDVNLTFSDYGKDEEPTSKKTDADMGEENDEAEETEANEDVAA